MHGVQCLDTRLSGENNQQQTGIADGRVATGVDRDSPPLYSADAQSSGAKAWLSNRVNRDSFI